MERSSVEIPAQRERRARRPASWAATARWERRAGRPSSWLGAVALALAVAAGVSGCKGCKEADPAAGDEVKPGEVRLVLDTRAADAVGEPPWAVGVALFDEETFDPVAVQPLDEPALWEVTSIETLPAPLSVDIGNAYLGWVVVVLDADGSGLGDGPLPGDLMAVSPTPVQTPATDLRLYLEETWED